MIKWGCIQPLTGGMYIGAMQATGCNAQWIIDYPGHKNIKTDKNGNELSCGNEAHLLRWLKKHNAEVPVYTLNRQMFQQDNDINPTFEQNTTPDFDGMDLVVAVPVCSGLSSITIASDSTKSERNCNMLWITRYTLNTIRPKVYVFENAPALSSDKGEPIRKELEWIADANGYSVTYFKTDTYLHHNPQKRPRTFAVFVKWRNGVSMDAPELKCVNDIIEADEYLNEIPDNATQQTTFQMSLFNRVLLDYCIDRFGADWQQKTSKSYTFVEVCNGTFGSLSDFEQFINKIELTEDEKNNMLNIINRVKQKLAEGKNFYLPALTIYKSHTPSIQFKSLQCLLHHKENRLLTVREALWLMGLPHDFELIGDPEIVGPQIGQNVPVGTAKYIVSEAVRILENWDTIERTQNHQSPIINNCKIDK